MKYILFVTALFFSGSLFCQISIKLEDAAKHIGDSVSVCGKVAGGAFIESMDNSPTFLNLGAEYPNQLLNLVIWEDQRNKYNPVPEIQYINKTICVTGKIELIYDLPEIVIHSQSQIKVTE